MKLVAPSLGAAAGSFLDMARGLPEHRWGPHSKGTPRDATSRLSMREPPRAPRRSA